MSRKTSIFYAYRYLLYYYELLLVYRVLKISAGIHELPSNIIA